MTKPISENETILIQRTLRSGQAVRYPGHVVVIGDVNPGAEITAGGNIIVLGTLRGFVHAGAMGNEEAIVAALKLAPTQLRISDHITRPPDGENWDPQQPEVARIKNGIVVIEEYQSLKERHLALYQA